MSFHDLSNREAEIVELAIQGFTNEAIAHKLGISIGTVNTYWVRVRMKTGRTEAVAMLIKDRAETALKAANIEKSHLVQHLAAREHSLLELRAEISLLQLALDQIRSTVWATDEELRLQIIANGKLPSQHCGVIWEVGKTVYEIFKSIDPKHPPIAAHLAALKGKESNIRLKGQFKNMYLNTIPMKDEHGQVIGCIGIMNVLAPPE
jgi:DNA-binding CsgD family transcriptional regulator